MSDARSPASATPDPDEGLLRVAVVGHTNTGKTSLMRTLLRDERFGEVADRPAVTTSVEVARLRADGRDVVALADTPGLEDPIGLLERLEGTRRPDEDGVDALRRVLDEPDAAPGARFSQEAMSLRQVLASDAVLYVIDARDAVRAKHRDELTILAWTARPVVPVLNFVAGDHARTSAWRDQLRRVAMHAVAAFDTVVFQPEDELRLYEKIRTLVHEAGPMLDALIAARTRERRELLQAAARTVAELLVDAAASVAVVESDDRRRVAEARATGTAGGPAAVERFRDTIRAREAQCTARLLELFRFGAHHFSADAVRIVDGRWGLDLFSPEALKRHGLRAGGAAAAGAAVGLGIDAAVGGLSLGAGTLTGAAIGGTIELSRTHGRRLFARLRGRTELRVDDVTLRLLATRNMELARQLARRGHAAVDPIRRAGDGSNGSSPSASRAASPPPDAPIGTNVLDAAGWRTLRTARVHPRWATDPAAPATTPLDPGRDEVVRAIAAQLTARLAPDAASTTL